MDSRTHTYFASDFHLGLKAGTDPLERERHVVRWLTEISSTAKSIYLVGDLFDFWWEYKMVVPKGFTRFLGKISELTDAGVEVHFFTGNHDMWIGDYLAKECGMILHTGEYRFELNGRRFCVAHGEGVGVRDKKYLALLWVFRNRFLRSLYSMLHPRIGIALAHRWSLSSRLAKSYSREFRGEEKEPLVRYAREAMQDDDIDFFIFGHRHIPLDLSLSEKNRLLILGNWFNAPVYADWNGEEMTLREYKSDGYLKAGDN
ncbi:MAG: UDP-2,3-diacylglucosamine diphosphatase [Bacteroidales bacterium]|nr:UDP-2,3-diacylglucosamine diphosphatase [Bacteroidales bacterium]